MVTFLNGYPLDMTMDLSLWELFKTSDNCPTQGYEDVAIHLVENHPSNVLVCPLLRHSYTPVTCSALPSISPWRTGRAFR